MNKNYKQLKELEHWETENGLYIALLDFNLAFTQQEIYETVELHNKRKSCKLIGYKLGRDPDEIAILKIDLAKRGVIE